MPDYDFRSLSDVEFETVVQDVLSAHWHVQLARFPRGSDQGIDLRYLGCPGDGIVVQCKHYVESSFASLLRALGDEAPKVSKLDPPRYVVVTSQRLTAANKRRIALLFPAYIKDEDQDILGREAINDLLRIHDDVERRHPKLWLASAGVLVALLNNADRVRGQWELKTLPHDLRVFVPGGGYDAARTLLDQYHSCLLAGGPGVGKTITARMLMLEHSANGYEIHVVTNDIEEAFSVFDDQKRQFFLYDDFLGTTALRAMLHKNEDQRLLQFLAVVRRAPNARLVLTTREYILRQAMEQHEPLARGDLDPSKLALDMSSYSKMDRARILYNHIYFSELRGDTRTAVLANGAYRAIVNHPNYNPRIIESIIRMAEHGPVPAHQLVPFAERHLENPVAVWSHVFEHQLTDSERWFCLVMVTLPEFLFLKDAERAYDAYRSAESLTSSKVRDVVRRLDGTFLAVLQGGDGTSTTTVVRLFSPSVRDFLLGWLNDHPDECDALLQRAFFFEQMESLLHLSSFLPRKDAQWQNLKRHLTRQAPLIIGAAQRLLAADPCRLQYATTVRRYVRDPADADDRLATVVGAMAAFSLLDWNWLFDMLGRRRVTWREPGVGCDVRAVWELLQTMEAHCAPLLTDEVFADARNAVAESDDYEAVIAMADEFPRLQLEDERDAALDALAFDVEDELRTAMESNRTGGFEAILSRAHELFDLGAPIDEELLQQANSIMQMIDDEAERALEDYRPTASRASGGEDDMEALFERLRDATE